jgi:hypothetical protein
VKAKDIFARWEAAVAADRFVAAHAAASRAAGHCTNCGLDVCDGNHTCCPAPAAAPLVHAAMPPRHIRKGKHGTDRRMRWGGMRKTRPNAPSLCGQTGERDIDVETARHLLSPAVLPVRPDWSADLCAACLAALPPSRKRRQPWEL